MQDLVPRVLEGIAAAHGVDVDVRHASQYPLTINDPDQTAFAAATISEVFDAARHARLDAPFNGSEDFSRVLAAVPGSFIGLGAAPAGRDPGTAPFNHSPFAQYDDAVLPDGAALHAQARPAPRRTGHRLADAVGHSAAQRRFVLGSLFGFNSHIRRIAVGIPYSLCVAAFGGTAPYLQQYLAPRSAWFTVSVIVLLLISAAVISRLPETRGRELHEETPPLTA